MLRRRDWKRPLDIGLALLMVVVLAPLAAAVALLLVVSGERRIIFRQARVGRGGATFTLYKFTTMRSDRDRHGSGTLTSPKDPRVTRVGRWLRATKLNELPQLLNVLRGDMSLVGPRPVTPDVFAFYSPKVSERILRVRPGLTGLGSIVFRNEALIFSRSTRGTRECYRYEIAPYKGRLEAWYVERRSLVLDLKLLALTGLGLLLPSGRLPLRLLGEVPRPTACAPSLE